MSRIAIWEEVKFNVCLNLFIDGCIQRGFLMLKKKTFVTASIPTSYTSVRRHVYLRKFGHSDSAKFVHG